MACAIHAIIDAAALIGKDEEIIVSLVKYHSSLQKTGLTPDIFKDNLRCLCNTSHRRKEERKLSHCINVLASFKNFISNITLSEKN